MKAYWDSSALIQSIADIKLEGRLIRERGLTRTHALTEVFSTLTGGLGFRFSANDATATIKALVQHLDFADLTKEEILNGFDQAQARGVRGGRIHDYVHALAAKKAGAAVLLTTDKNDFKDLVPGLVIEKIPTLSRTT